MASAFKTRPNTSKKQLEFSGECLFPNPKHQRTATPTTTKKLHQLFTERTILEIQNTGAGDCSRLPKASKKPSIKIRITPPTPASSISIASCSHLASTSSPARPKSSPIFCSQNLMKIFNKWKAELPEEPFIYRANSHDFGIEIKSLLLDNSSVVGVDGCVDPSTMRIYENMQNIGERQGFIVIPGHIPNFPRDGWILTPQYGITLPSKDEHLEKAMQINDSQHFCSGKSAVHSSSHSSFHKLLGTVSENDRDYEYYLKIRGIPVNRLNYYLEGGNYYLCTNATGKND